MPIGIINSLVPNSLPVLITSKEFAASAACVASPALRFSSKSALSFALIAAISLGVAEAIFSASRR
jgi:hypothetical protein